ncbi:MAG TPA: hypothetical protein VGJ91_24025, partial [Polyangiaceae bacterium]
MKHGHFLLGAAMAAGAAGCTRHEATQPPLDNLATRVSAAEPHAMPKKRLRLPNEGELPELDGATEWLNSPPLTKSGLRGKVVLVDFWTYSCINWRRTLPYLRAWADKYRTQGLVVIGTHTPEFQFE